MAGAAQRDISERTIRRALTYATEQDLATRLVRDIRTRSAHLFEAWNNFRNVHALLTHQAEEQAERDQDNQLYDEVENAYLDASARMQERIHNANSYPPSAAGSENGDDLEPYENHVGNNESNHQHNAQPNPLPGAGPPPNYNVPQIIVHCGNKKVEKTWSDFDGTATQWQGFHDLFKSAVHDNPALTVAEKFAQLKLSLKGKAAAALGDYQLTDQNYQEAWARLKALYQCEYTASKELLWKFNSLPKLTHANATMIQRFSNVTHQVLRQLKAMNYPTEHYDLVMVHSLHDKLDASTSYEWGKTRKSDRPTIIEMLTFLDRHAKNLSDAQHVPGLLSTDQRKRHQSKNDSRVDHKHAKPNAPNEQKSMQNTNYTRKCKVCNKESHPVHRCPKFIKMDLSARRNAAKEHHLCYNCLSTQHTSKDCKASACKRCDKRHNSLLCGENPMNKAANAMQLQKLTDKNQTKTANDKKL